MAVVDEDPIFLSDVELAIAIGRLPRLEDEADQAYRRRVLAFLVDERLALHEVERYALAPLDPQRVNSALDDIRDGFSSEEEMAAELARRGLDPAGLRQLVMRQLRVLQYVRERLEPRVFVDLDDIRDYYESELRRQVELSSMELPPLDEVRELIRNILRERRLDREIELWQESLRAAADLDLFLEPSTEDWPPLLQQIEATTTPSEAPDAPP